jgi:hypothetical protein
MSMAEDTRYRSDHSRDEPGSDPLTELARLIGQSDPFADKARRASAHLDAQDQHRQAPGWLARSSDPAYDQPGFADDPAAQPYAAYRAPAADPHTDYDAGNESYDQYAPQAYAHDRYAQGHHADVRYAEEGYEHSGDDRYRVAPPAGDYESDEYYDDGHLPPRSEEDGVLAGASRRGGLVTIAAVLGLALIGTAGAFGYRAFTSPSAESTPPVIKADPNPAKTTPAAPSADAQDKPFQDRVSTPGTVQTERIVPREEAPVAQPVPPAAAAPVAPWPAPPRAGAAVPPAAAAAPPANPDARRVRTETIRMTPNGDPTGATRPPAPVPAAPTRGAKQNPGTPMTIAPAAEAAPPAARVQTARVAPTAAADGAYVVQVSAQKTEGEAQSSYRALQQKYPGVLGGREATIRRADLGDKGIYYRAQIGGFASAGEATNFCDSLKASGGQCIVQKN